MDGPGEFFEKIIESIPGAKAGKMFSAKCIKMPNGKVGAMLWRDMLVIKMDAAGAEEALVSYEAEPFTPMEGRKMNNWFTIPFTQKKHWKELAAQSCAEAALLTVKKKKKSRPAGQ